MSVKGNVYFKQKLSGVIEKKDDGTFSFSYKKMPMMSVGHFLKWEKTTLPKIYFLFLMA